MYGPLGHNLSCCKASFRPPSPHDFFHLQFFVEWYLDLSVSKWGLDKLRRPGKGFMLLLAPTADLPGVLLNHVEGGCWLLPLLGLLNRRDMQKMLA